MASAGLPGEALPRERVLFRFGPFGVSVCRGPYSIWKWQRKNVTVIELTDWRIVGIPNRRPGLGALRPTLGSMSFEIPYAEIVSLQVYDHPARLGLMQVLDIKYRVGEGVDAGVEERSVCTYNQTVQRAYETIKGCMGQAGCSVG